MNTKQFKHLATRGLLALLLVLSSFNHLQAQNKNRSQKESSLRADPSVRYFCVIEQLIVGVVATLSIAIQTTIPGSAIRK
jgi:hypothetical protein